MIDRTELLRMIMETNPGQSPAYVLEQYATYLKGLDGIHGCCCSSNIGTIDDGKVSQEDLTKKEAKPSLTCGYTKRSLKVKPDQAISNDKIICCICAKEGQTLTARHLAGHNGLTPEGYKKLCGYDATQPLMSKNHFNRMKKNVLKAQNARKAKKKAAD